MPVEPAVELLPSGYLLHIHGRAMAHRNRWFTELKNGGSFHGKLLNNQRVNGLVLLGKSTMVFTIKYQCFLYKLSHQFYYLCTLGIYLKCNELRGTPAWRFQTLLANNIPMALAESDYAAPSGPTGMSSHDHRNSEVVGW